MSTRLLWEKVNQLGRESHESSPIYRARVPGGWLLKVVTQAETTNMNVLFIPDPSYTWDQWE